MTMGTGVVLLAIGAILRYAVNDSIDKIDLQTVGLILMLVGAFGLALGIYLTFVRGRPDPTVGDPSLRDPPRGQRY